MAQESPQEPPKIRPGSRVRMHFSLGLADGTEAVSTFDEEPIEFRMGDGTLSEGLELALYGVYLGTEESLTLDGGEVYGPRNPELVQDLDRTRFPVDIDPRPGLIVAFSTPDGDELPGAVMEVGDATVRVDFNHPLAGREIRFRFHILDIQPADA